MQTRRAVSYSVLEKVVGAQCRFAMSKGVQIEIDLRFYADLPFTVYYVNRRVSVPVAVRVNQFVRTERCYGVDEVVVEFNEPESRGADGEPDGFQTHTLVHFVRSKAIGIAPMDTTPMEIQTKLPAPTMEEIIRREFDRRFGNKRKVDDEPQIEDEVVARAGGTDYQIDDDDPDDPLEVSAADMRAAASRARKRRVQPVDGGSDTGQGSDRGGPSEGPGESEQSPSGS